MRTGRGGGKPRFAFFFQSSLFRVDSDQEFSVCVRKLSVWNDDVVSWHKVEVTADLAEGLAVDILGRPNLVLAVVLTYGSKLYTLFYLNSMKQTKY